MNRLSLLALATCSVLSWTQPASAGGFGYHVRCAPVYCEPCYIDYCCSSIIPEIPPDPRKPIEEIAPDPRLSMFQRPTDRTWVYGKAPRLVIGTLAGLQGGNVRIESSRGIVSIPVEQLSAIDQKLVATQLAKNDRVWTDGSGRYHREAEFVRVDGRNVVLKTKAGKAVNIDYGKLSVADQCLVQQLSGSPIPDVIAAPSRSALATR